MTKEQQTEEVKLRLWNLTTMFVQKYVHKYYKQYKGDLHDLISRFYVEFLTEKSREKGKEESLLDKFDPKVTSLEYLVKIAVQRKLIDESRKNPYRSLSLEKMQEDYGDCILDMFQVTAESTEIHFSDQELPVEFCQQVKSRFDRLEDALKERIYHQYEEVQNILAPAFKVLYKSLFKDFAVEGPNLPKFKDVVLVLTDVTGTKFECKCQQVTPKTACVLFNNEVIDFDRITGTARNKANNMLRLSAQSVQWIAENIQVYKSGYSRQEFVSAFS